MAGPHCDGGHSWTSLFHRLDSISLLPELVGDKMNTAVENSPESRKSACPNQSIGDNDPSFILNVDFAVHRITKNQIKIFSGIEVSWRHGCGTGEDDDKGLRASSCWARTMLWASFAGVWWV